MSYKRSPDYCQGINHSNEKQEALLLKFRQNICSSTTKLVANTINMYMYVTFNLLMVLEKYTFFRKLTIYVAPATNQIKQFRQKSYEMWRTIQ